MATTSQVEQAMAQLSAARRRLFEASSRRAVAITQRGRLEVGIDELNQAVQAARTQVQSASVALRAILAEPETPDPPAAAPAAPG